MLLVTYFLLYLLFLFYFHYHSYFYFNLKNVYFYLLVFLEMLFDFFWYFQLLDQQVTLMLHDVIHKKNLLLKWLKNIIIVKKPNSSEYFNPKTHGNNNAISTSKIKNKYQQHKNEHQRDVLLLHQKVQIHIRIDLIFHYL